MMGGALDLKRLHTILSALLVQPSSQGLAFFCQLEQGLSHNSGDIPPAQLECSVTHSMSLFSVCTS